MRLLLLKFCFCLLIPVAALTQNCPGTALSSANNKFAFDIYKVLHQQKESLFFSPYSIFTALQMTADGAKGTTSAEMLSALHSSGDLDCIHRDISKTQQQFKALLSSGDSVHVANSLWMQKTFSLNPSFVNQVKDNYKASLQELDFAKSPELSRTTINNWVEEQTHNRIKDLLAPGTISTDTRLVLVNAIWLKAKWLIPFHHESTKDDKFYAQGKEVMAPFMNNTATVNYAEDETMQMIELPYKSQKLSMIIALPVKGKEDDFSKRLNYEQAGKWINSMTPQRTAITVPKFKMTSSFNLNDVLMKLGIKTAFSDNADFSGMSAAGLKISNVIHKAFIEVDEAGTEAAAATAITMVTTSVMMPPKIEKIFNANHPFVFFLYDKEAKTILFMGKMEKP